MGHLVHNAFYELAVFQAHKLFFDNIYWSYSFCRIVGVFYLDFNRHDIQIDKTRRLFPDRTISSPPSNAWQFASQRNQSTVITNVITDVIKRSTWIRSTCTYSCTLIIHTHLFLCYPMLFWNDGSLGRWWQPCVSSLPLVLFPERQKKMFRGL